MINVSFMSQYKGEFYGLDELQDADSSTYYKKIKVV